MCSINSRHKNGTEWRNFYGRFKGKSLSATQTKALLTEFEKYSLQNISWKNLFSEIISFNEYNFIHLNHNSFSLMGSHGPYSINNVNDKSYDLIDSEFFYSSLNSILEKDHWLQPPIDNSKVSILLHRAKDLSNSASDIYMLNSSFNKPTQPYDHEWSHAFIEYYEYFVITPNKVFVWSLVYE